MNDDTPSTEERERARAELKSEAAKHGSRDFWPPVNLVYERVRANRLAARVAAAEAERDDVIKRMVDAAYEHRAELAKLRAAAAPVELPGDTMAYYRVLPIQSQGCSEPDGWYIDVDPPHGMFRTREEAIAHCHEHRRRILALPPQEDVRGAIADALEEDASRRQPGRPSRTLESWAERIRTWPPAPRTEGGGDHGEC